MRETVSPEEIEKATFATALRGYDRDEVDSYLRSLAVDLKEAEKQRTERFYQSLGEEMGGLLQHARDSSDAMVKEAEEESKRLRDSARSDAEQMRADASKDAKETRANAESEAAANIAEAEQRAADTRTKAEEDARAREFGFRASPISSGTSTVTRPRRIRMKPPPERRAPKRTTRRFGSSPRSKARPGDGGISSFRGFQPGRG
jgi:cell division initiation protein